MTNRFLRLENELARSTPRNRNGGVSRSVGRTSGIGIATSKKPKCTQFSEMAIDDDQFILDVLQFFFDERLEPGQLNEELRDIAATVVWSATESSKAMDLIPRPPKDKPSPKWLVQEAVQIAIRAAQNKCIYEAVRVTAKRNFRSAYDIAKSGVMGMSLNGLDLAGSPKLVQPSDPGTLHGVPGYPRPNLTTSQRGIDMIAGFERFSAMPYTDAANDCRVGYGHLVHSGPCAEGGEYAAGINEQRARELLKERIQAVEPTVNRTISPAATQHQFDAIVSFAVNVGDTTFESSNLAQLLAAGRSTEVPSELLLWVNGEGSPIPGLVKRRKAEAELFATGDYPGDAEMSVVKSLGIDLNEFDTGPRSIALTDTGIDWCQIRHDIIRSAVEMQGEWLRSGGLMGESHGDALALLIKFWEVGVGMPRTQAESVAALSASDHPDQAFWSAAFISWCVRNAMPNPPPPHDGGFLYHRRHMAYIAQAARNRAAGDATRPFWLYDINDPNVIPEGGDILCLNRSGTNHSFASVKTNWVTNNSAAVATGSSHTDIVIGTFQDGDRSWIETIGGNVGDTVGSRYYSIDANGRLVDSVTLNGTTKRGKSNVTQSVAGRAPIVFALIRLTACPDFG